MARIRAISKNPNSDHLLTLKETFHLKKHRVYKKYLMISCILNASLIIYVILTTIY